MCEEAARDGGTWAYQAMAGEEATVDSARQMRRHRHGGDVGRRELVAGGPARGKGVEPGADLCRGGSGAPVHVEASGAAVVAVAVGVGGGRWEGWRDDGREPDGNQELGLFLGGDLNLLSSLRR